MLNVSVIGQDTLAMATFECCSRHHRTTSVLTDTADVIWFCYDTPILPGDYPDVDWVMNEIKGDINHLDDEIGWTVRNPLLVVSSQLPVGSTAKLEAEFPNHTFAHQPENIRVKTAIDDFNNQSRMVIGVRNNKYEQVICQLLGPFTGNVIWTDPETAEMSKAALNTFLALQIAYINEIAKICTIVGADIEKVSEAIKTDSRVSPRAPLRAGAPYGGGHLAREIFNMNQIADKAGIKVPIIAHIKKSNDE